jgi:polysaccharide biosynthesis/export protein
LLSYRSASSRKGLNRRHVILAGVAMLSACSSAGGDLPPVPAPTPGEYILGPDDQVRIITFGEEQLTGEFGVDASGDISLPLVGSVHAAGLTPRQLTSAITGALVKSKLYQNPSVSVEVVAYRPVFILGEVTKPGQYPYQPGMSVVTAVAVAGGFTYRAKTTRFSIVRSTPTGTVEGSAVRETLVQPGDVITVDERIF